MKKIALILFLLFLIPKGNCQVYKFVDTSYFIDFLEIDSIIIKGFDLNTMTFTNVTPSIYDSIYDNTTKKIIIQSQDHIFKIIDCLNNGFVGGYSDGIDVRGKFLLYFRSKKVVSLYYGSTDVYFNGCYYIIQKCLFDMVDSYNTLFIDKAN